MLGNNDPFYSSKYLIRRAKHHADEFKTLFADFIEGNPYRRAVDYDPDTGEDVYKIKLTKPVPKDLSGIGFDCANNLRSALDNAVFTITKSQIGEYVGFPIRRNAASFEEGLKRYCKGVPPELKNLIRAFKPYNGGNKLLWALDELCNTNKHAVVSLAVTIIPSYSGSKVANSKGEITWYMPHWDRVKDEMIYDRSPHGTENKTQINAPPIVSFADINFIGFKPAVVVLYEFINEVKGIVTALETEAIRIKWL